MRLVVPIILSVAVAGFHSVISASLQLHERTESPEERDELEFEAAHVEDEESLGVTHMEANVEESEEIEVLDEKETEGENADSDESVEHSEQAEENVESVEDITADQSIEYYDS
ncbi:ring-infected erythrocyte surface antigen isoform X4 [Myxocyprinus asiaticus]|uniref:ring-infected erythrocyte surface antigen isoform X4 n=1 Tax=Myxocyprinus asiaticus TaxID=70543 RepID=UPI00222327A9|nr:ring-infected erythrocyte surface antigen isoform X4 [Myxocyprinus asiaticus]